MNITKSIYVCISLVLGHIFNDNEGIHVHAYQYNIQCRAHST